MAGAGDEHAWCAQHGGHARVAGALRLDHAGKALRLGRVAAMAIDDVALERALHGLRRGRESGARGIRHDGARFSAREVGGHERPAMLERELHERSVERPVPALAVEAAGIGQRFRVSGRRVDRRLVVAIELLHGEQALVAASRERFEHDALQAMVFGIVVRLAQDQLAGARGAVK